jgi:hypothetical protein
MRMHLRTRGTARCRAAMQSIKPLTNRETRGSVGWLRLAAVRICRSKGLDLASHSSAACGACYIQGRGNGAFPVPVTQVWRCDASRCVSERG